MVDFPQQTVKLPEGIYFFCSTNWSTIDLLSTSWVMHMRKNMFYKDRLYS